MNLQKIFDDTDFVHTSGTKEELQVAEYLKAQCETLGAKTYMEAFRVPMGDIEFAPLLEVQNNSSPYRNAQKRQSHKKL